FMLVGLCLLMFSSLAIITFLPSYMIRSLHVSLSEVSVSWGIAIAIAQIVGLLGGGILAGRLGRSDVRWYAWLLAAACVLGAIAYTWALLSDKLWICIAADFIAEALMASCLAIVFPAIQVVCGSPRRAMALA